MLRNQSPLILIHLIAIELLQSIDASTRDVRVQGVLLLKLSAVHWLVAALDLDGDGGLAFLADGDLFVIAFDARTVNYQ
jgi:hypothetical protein